MATTKKAAPKKAAGGKTPKGNSTALVDAVAKKLGGGAYGDTLMSADAYVTRAKKAGKSDAEIAKMTKAQLMKF